MIPSANKFAIWIMNLLPKGLLLVVNQGILEAVEMAWERIHF